MASDLFVDGAGVAGVAANFERHVSAVAEASQDLGRTQQQFGGAVRSHPLGDEMSATVGQLHDAVTELGRYLHALGGAITASVEAITTADHRIASGLPRLVV